MYSSEPIRMVDLKRQYQSIKEEVDEAIHEVIDSTAFINGSAVNKFADELAQYTGARHVIPCANGTDAIQICYMALGLKPGDEVVMPAFNYVASAEAAALLGLRPVFAEVCPDTFNIDVEKLESKLTWKTKAIVVVHLFGQMVPMEPIMTISQRYKLPVIEDNAQAIGARYTFPDGSGKASGTIAQLGTTSFFPSKNLGCFGDGGAIFTNDDTLAEKVRMGARHGQKIKYSYESVGCNSRLDTIQAAILRVKLRYLDEYNRKRIEAAAVYDRLLAGCDEIETPARSEFSTHVYHQYVIKVPASKRESIREALKEAGVPTMVYYPSPLHMERAYRHFGPAQGRLPVAEKLCGEVLALPMHPELTSEEQHYIVEHLLKAL